MPATHTHDVTIQFLDGGTIRGGFSRPLYSDVWGWVVEAVAERSECREDEVDCIDTDDRHDCITVRGEIIGHLDYGFRKDEPVAMLQAAE